MLQPNPAAPSTSTLSSASISTNSTKLPLQKRIEVELPPICAASPPALFPSAQNALENSIVTLLSTEKAQGVDGEDLGPQKTIVCVFCPGKRLKEGKMTEVHLAGKEHIKRSNKFKIYLAAASPAYAEFDARFITQEMDAPIASKITVPIVIAEPVEQLEDVAMEVGESKETKEIKKSNKRARSEVASDEDEGLTETELKLKKKKLQKAKSIELERQKKAAADLLPDANRDAAVERKEKTLEISAAKKLVHSLKATSKKAKNERQKAKKLSVASANTSDITSAVVVGKKLQKKKRAKINEDGKKGLPHTLTTKKPKVVLKKMSSKPITKPKTNAASPTKSGGTVKARKPKKPTAVKATAAVA